MNLPIYNRPTIEKDLSTLEEKGLNFSLNEVTNIKSGNYNKSKLSNQLLNSTENDMEETNNNTINRTPILVGNNRNIKKGRKVSENIHSEMTKLNKYLQETEKTKIKGRRDSSFLPTIKKELIKTKEFKKERKDRNGIVINKKNKRKVQVTFIDMITDEPLENVIKIESFKKYNFIKNMPKEDFMIKSRCECCSIY